MYTWALFSYVALHTHCVFASHYHGPLAKPVVLKSGYLADTHDVAASKHAHLSAVSSQSHGHGGDYSSSGSYGYSHNDGHVNSYNGHGDLRYHGPTAIPHVLHDGHIADTHEVAAAKAEHLAAVSKAKSHGGYTNYYSGQYAGEHGTQYGPHYNSHHSAPYHGPIAKPVVLKSGYLADTHEVSAAKDDHLEALHNAKHCGQYDYHIENVS